MKRLIYWRAQKQRALLALRTGEWWNGRVWRPHAALPRTRKEADAHRTAHDRLGEILDAMVGGEGDARLRKARNFRQSANAMRKRDPRKDASRDAWAMLVARFTEARLLTGPLTKQLLCDCLKELGKPWELEGVKSFLRRRRQKL